MKTFMLTIVLLATLTGISHTFISCKKDAPAEILPIFTMLNTSHQRTMSGSIMRLVATLNKASANAVSVSYTLVQGTAQSPRDFTSSTGIITIPPNQIQATLEIPITGTAIRQDDQQFTIQLSSPINCTINTPLVTATILNTDIPNLPVSLFWSEEFNKDGALNPDIWGYNTGNGTNGWGNNELEYYTDRPENVLIKDGVLKITAKKEAYNGYAYTSARVLTMNKFAFKYGRIDIRAKLPEGNGTWPALWMLGANLGSVGWPACGEIDIMEHAGIRLNKITTALHHPGHSGGNPDGGSLSITGATTDFHIYSLDWTAAYMKFYVDNQLFFNFPNSSSIPFNQDFFLILNVAMGGGYGGAIDPAFVSSSMEVDYIRIYK